MKRATLMLAVVALLLPGSARVKAGIVCYSYSGTGIQQPNGGPLILPPFN